jgi:cysteine synthase A
LHSVFAALVDPEPSVCTAAGDRVPGPRSLALLSPVEFPWRDSVDAIEEIGSKDAFGMSLKLCREGLICGPSSGFNLQGKIDDVAIITSLICTGLLTYLSRRKAAGTLNEIAGQYGLTQCAFICCDLPYQYVDDYFDKLGDTSFFPIRNEVRSRILCPILI